MKIKSGLGPGLERIKGGRGLVLGLGLVLLAGPSCTRVVDVRTTSEVRPMRYALHEFGAAPLPADSAIAVARRALTAENIAVLREVRASATVEGGPVRFAAEGEQPALDATVTITAGTQDAGSRFRVYASAILPAGAVGGVDPRLTALVQKISRRIESIISP